MLHALSSGVAMLAFLLCVYQLFKQDRTWHPIRGLIIAISTTVVVYLNFLVFGPKWNDIWFILHAITGCGFFFFLLSVVLPTGVWAWVTKRQIPSLHYVGAYSAVLLLAISLFFAIVSAFVRP